MLVARLELEEFRCFRRLTLDVPPFGFRLFGPNGSGKTSVIEALYLLATTKSFRSTADRHLIHRESAKELGLAPYARVSARIETSAGTQSIEIVLSLDPATTSVTKRYRRDGRAVRAMDFVGTLRVVLFSPEDIELITGSPSIRRRYLDIVLSTTDPAYLRALANYARVLEQRNSLLKQLTTKDRRAIDQELAFWDEQLVTYGAYLIVARLRFLAIWSRLSAAFFGELSSESGTLATRYSSSVPLPDQVSAEIEQLAPTHAQAAVSVRYKESLDRLRPDELRRGTTLVGPHRDDLHWLLGDEPLVAIGSRGIHRLAVLAGKLAEVSTVSRMTGDWPVLLLDDVLSELDHRHRVRLLSTLATFPAQRILTAADRSVLDQPGLDHLPLACLEEEDRSLRFE
ncbi:MAG: DNA replication/repair protein RecF [Thermomicrobium sp.]|nr:DNA replication/repair protein RecF [Thermomicrobium sp.]